MLSNTKKLGASAILGGAVITGAAHADPVNLVELFTSQGCSSCPAADDILTRISDEKGILALGFHVDYWDYLGWADTFGNKKFTERQRVYNMNIPSKYTLVTPQMVFHGQSQIAGASFKKTAQKIQELARIKPTANLSATLSGKKIAITVAPKSGRVQKSDVILVTYQPSIAVKIKRGENAGRTVTYTNIVSSWQKIGSWDGKSRVSINHSLSTDHSAAIVVQARNVGEIYAAETLN